MTLPVPVPPDLPRPSGYRILIAIPKMEEKIGSIYTPDAYRTAEQSASVVGNVIALGDLAYGDQDKFPSGPWCVEGDWVIFRAYSGTRLKVGDTEFRLINDDTVEGTVDDPRTISRAF